jgi:hypothetical protein
VRAVGLDDVRAAPERASPQVRLEAKHALGVAVARPEPAARTLWPDESPLGRRVVAGGDGTAEVVGVAADVRTSTLEQEGSFVVYLPSWEYPPSQGVVVVRTSGDPAVVASGVRAAIRRVDASVPVPNVRTMAQVVSSTVAVRRFQLGPFGLFALMAIVTASVGIHGVIAQSLASRTREMGVRMALGARPWDVHRLVLREGPPGVGCPRCCAPSERGRKNEAAGPNRQRRGIYFVLRIFRNVARHRRAVSSSENRLPSCSMR